MSGFLAVSLTLAGFVVSTVAGIWIERDDLKLDRNRGGYLAIWALVVLMAALFAARASGGVE